MADSFLGRWSQRKQAVRAGKTVLEPPRPSPQPSPTGRGSEQPEGASEWPSPQPSPAGRGGEQPGATSFATVAPLHPAPTGVGGAGPLHSAPSPQRGEGGGEGVAEAPALTLDDVTGLTAESDFKPFVARDVAPEVRNAAMKKLFANPHYQLMDRLDIYIDDYSQPDPLPESLLRQMASAKFLKLFAHEEEKIDQPEYRPGDAAATPAADFAPQTAPPAQTSATPLTENQPRAPGTDHDHTDLRLQPNHAAGPQEPGRGAE